MVSTLGNATTWDSSGINPEKFAASDQGTAASKTQRRPHPGSETLGVL